MSRWDNKCFMLYRVDSFIKNIVSLNFSYHKWSYFLKYVPAKLKGRVQRTFFLGATYLAFVTIKCVRTKKGYIIFNYRSATPTTKKSFTL